ncbi:protein S-acyltransferase [Malassezia caprae]|uniref:Palmitoyltransferase n=1 Tax=Malassezia caprae TaxID=1381934 RepID=A0AAF0E8H6_9BASI|nr:protein S-acyltransferase [Malassezia caprae]
MTEGTASAEGPHVWSQHGDLERLHAWIEGGGDVNICDPEGITPLHWAAINGHVACCRMLLERGADVHAIGGALRASPLHWCARNGHTQVLTLLLEHGANPLAKDGQGFHCLHLATQSSLVMAILYFLQLDLFGANGHLDSRDAQGHTALMWAAFQGDALSVDVLLKYGARLDAVDDDGLTPLHWAVVNGSALCIQRLVAAGSRLDTRERGGKTPRELAYELGTAPAFRQGMANNRLDEWGAPQTPRISPALKEALVFLVPLALYSLTFFLSSRAPWFLAPLVFLLGILGTHVLVARVLLGGRSPQQLQSTRYYLSLLCLSLIWVGIGLARSVAHGPARPSVLLSIAATLLFVSGSLVVCVSSSPGACVQPVSAAQRRSEVLSLAQRGQLHGLFFCVSCLARKPLRAKHCYVCKMCVARHDHHCPWIANCVGIRNHRAFVAMLLASQVGLPWYLWEVVRFFQVQVPASSVRDQTCPFPSACAAVQYDGMLYYSAVWLLITETWLFILTLAQLYQVAYQFTTFERSNLSRHGFMGGRPDAGMQGQAGYIRQQRERLAALGHSPAEIHRIMHGRTVPRRGWCGSLCQGGSALLALVGLELYTRPRQAVDYSSNPFDTGCYANCADFWTAGGYTHTDYTSLYEVPQPDSKKAR